MGITSAAWEQVKALRWQLHQHPDLSEQEASTAQQVMGFITEHAPADKVIEKLGGHGLAFIYEAADSTSGPTILLRAELDALPIQEGDGLPYHSHREHISHKCGHDGHMANLCAVALHLAQKRPPKGRVILLFQPAEENGVGMEAVLSDPKFPQIKPDIAIALHNIPGYPLGDLLIREGAFTTSAESLVMHFHGTTAHAAEPEKAVNPAPVIAGIIHYLDQLNRSPRDAEDFTRASVTYVNIGEDHSHGIAAGMGQLNVTLRARVPHYLESAKKAIFAYVEGALRPYNGELTVESKRVEPFVANMNDGWLVNKIIAGAEAAQVPVTRLPQPNDWGEDFGAMTMLPEVRGAMFGLGSGEDCLPLHHPDYDYPDRLIEVSCAIYLNTLREIWKD